MSSKVVDAVPLKKNQDTNFSSWRTFVVTTEINMSAAQYLLTEHKFVYVLPAVTSADPAENFLVRQDSDAGEVFTLTL